MKTKAAILWETNKPWSVEEIELDPPKPGEVLVKLAASGLCHSDEHLVTGATPVEFPVIGGHEGAGVVTKVGPGVSGLKEGDHVVTAFIPACGVCPPCSRGQQNLCDLGAHLLGGKAISDGTNRVTAKVRDNGDLELAAGDRIRHDDFGEGRVDAVTGEGAKRIAHVRFDSAGLKKLLIKIAPIEKI